MGGRPRLGESTSLGRQWDACYYSLRVNFLGCPKNVLDAKPWAWVYALSLFACAQVALLGLQGRAGVLPPSARALVVHAFLNCSTYPASWAGSLYPPQDPCTTASVLLISKHWHVLLPLNLKSQRKSHRSRCSWRRSHRESCRTLV
ncbi:hypothetical protein EDB92DRAFT_2104780 [Lactarius akahatsu]|uniref:Uncharacterized protein n=1 Tax=Lactarius akahatsu TaxID=416441 RepID=A0AAD4LEE3_9AGAM|nr:hypothetical protein EDB92DRAFT_2104780 [Lactarius akahatsu]